jgi:AraC-like DNA-binding protein
MLGYVLLSAARLYTYIKKRNGSRTFASQQSAIQWMKAFMIIEVLLVSAHLFLMLELFAFGNVGGYNRLNTFLYVLAAGPVAILLITFFSPGILYGLPRIPATANGSQPGEEKPGQTHAHLEEKPANRHFEDDYLQRIGHETGACMEKFRPFTNPGFNLAELSVLLHIPEHHLGYYFREVRKQSFSDYRSQWRVKHAKDLIAEGKTSEMTLEAIGLLSGFPNRDSFRTAFQRIEGMTPAAFVAQNQP